MTYMIGALAIAETDEHIRLANFLRIYDDRSRSRQRKGMVVRTRSTHRFLCHGAVMRPSTRLIAE
jgi:hypothetical protein